MFKLNDNKSNKNDNNDSSYDHTNTRKQHYKMKGNKLIIDNKIKSLIIVMLIVLFNLLNFCSANVVGIDEPKLNFDDPVTTIIAAKSDLSSIGDGILHNNNDVNSISSNNIDDKNDVDHKNIQNDDNSKSSSKLSNLGFIHAFIASISVIIVSELGDKTFFIAAIMAMRHPRLTVFTGAMSALALMTILSAVFGMAATIIPRVYTYYISTALFAIFGIKMLKEGYAMSAKDTQEEFKKCEDELEKGVSVALVQDAESGLRKSNKSSAAYLASRIFMQAFTMTFLAEWGDRSQLTTIILSAREDVYGVIVGGVLGHSLCTGLAVVGGRIIAQKISVRTVTLVGGVVFLLFAISALFFNPNEEQP